MEILITESQLRKLLKEEYSEKVIEQLLDKFTAQTNVDRSKIKNYIKIFDKIKNGPNITNKDIITYTFPELEGVVLNYIKKDKRKSYKGDSNLDLVHSENGLNIYVADSKEKCIKYGEGYSFCISSRGEDSLYDDYRIDKEGTPYFIFNTNLEGSKDADDADEKTFLDPEHLMVLFVYWPNSETLEDIQFEDGEFNENDAYSTYYSITNANNNGEYHFLNYESIEKIYPSLKGLKNIFEPKGLTKNEQQMLGLTQYCDSMLKKINQKYNEGRGTNEVCPKYESRYYSYKQLIDVDDYMSTAYLNSYRDKLFKTYAIIGPHPSNNKIMYLKLTKFVGPKAEVDVRHGIMDFIDYYKGNPIENDELNKTLTSLKNYTIKVCNWSTEFIDYLGEVNDLYRDVMYKKWLITQDKN